MSSLLRVIVVLNTLHQTTLAFVVVPSAKKAQGWKLPASSVNDFDDNIMRSEDHPLPSDIDSADTISSLEQIGSVVGPHVSQIGLTLEPSDGVKKRKHAIPDWGKAINKVFEMPMITHQDKYHLHAASSSLWILWTYPLLFSSLIQEFTSDDWGLFSSNVLLFPSGLLGLVMAMTALPMLPSSRRFSNYTGQMKHAMMTSVLLTTMAVSFLTSYTAPLELLPTTATVGVVALLWTALEGRPWNILPIMEELKICDDLGPAVVATYALSFAWIGMALPTLLHGCGSSVIEDPFLASFAAQMAISLAVTPVTDAIIAGTFMKNERYNNKTDREILLVSIEGGGVRPARWVEALQLTFAYPGPALFTIAAAAVNGHWDVVEKFFFVDQVQTLFF